VLLDPAKNLEIGSRFPGLSLEALRRRAAAGHRRLQTRARAPSTAGWPTTPTAASPSTSSWSRSPTTRHANYTKRVLASYFAYCWLYGNKPVPEVSFKLGGGGIRGTRRR